MKNQFAAVIGLAAMLLLLVAVACTSSAPPPRPHQAVCERAADCRADQSPRADHWNPGDTNDD